MDLFVRMILFAVGFGGDVGEGRGCVLLILEKMVGTVLRSSGVGCWFKLNVFKSV